MSTLRLTNPAEHRARGRRRLHDRRCTRDHRRACACQGACEPKRAARVCREAGRPAVFCWLGFLLSLLGCIATGSHALAVTAQTAGAEGRQQVDTSSAANALDRIERARPRPKPEAQAQPEPLRHAKWSAIVDGGWSILMTAAWALSARSWSAPHLQGITGLVSARVLYGTTWSVLVASEISLLRALAGPSWSGLSHAEIRNVWWLGRTIPASCGGWDGACGLGLGGYSELSVRVLDGPVPIEVLMTGGWIQGHHSTSPTRTLVESTWVQAPLIGRARFELKGHATLSLALGAGVYYGMHNAHAHPRAKASTEVRVPFHEIVPLDAGLGLGVHARLRLTLWDLLSLESAVDLSPFLLSYKARHVPSEVVPILASEPQRGAALVWRQGSIGLTLDRRFLYPVRLGVHAFGLELSTRPIRSLGHRGLMIAFDVPFEIEMEDRQ